MGETPEQGILYKYSFIFNEMQFDVVLYSIVMRTIIQLNCSLFINNK